MKMLLATFLCLFTFYGEETNSITEDDGRTIKIPVVFHIISQNSNELVSKAVTMELIEKEIEDLNKNYGATNDMSSLIPGSSVPIGNAKIQFYLADIDGSNDDKGVFRTIGRSNHKSHKVVSPSSHLNICVGSFGSVTQMSAPHNHKVHINYKNIGDGGNTVTHELGHYFGLWHVWGKTNCRKMKYPWESREDNIADTPKQKNCTDLSRKKPCPETLTNKNYNANNFMDYSGCRILFSQGQVTEIRNNIINHRPEIYNNSL